MANWSKQYLTFIVLLAITPMMVKPALLLLSDFFNSSLPGMPISGYWWIIALLVVALCVIAKLRKWHWLLAPFYLLMGLVRFVLRPLSFDRKFSQFLPWWKRLFFLNRWNKGFVIDGVNQISRKRSFENLVAVAGVGGGKTSTTVVTSLLNMDDCSFVATDLSGELLEKTGADLEARGYEVKVLNLMDLQRGHFYNPIEDLSTYSEIANAAHIIVNSSKAMKDAKDPFWGSGAVKLIRILLTVMKNLGEPEHMCLANLKFLLSNFDYDKPNSKISKLIVRATIDDPETYNDYKSFVQGNSKTIDSFLSTADGALAGLHPELAKITSKNEIDFRRLRTHKTALFVAINQQDMDSFEFIINLFYTRLISVLLEDLESARKGLPVFCILDEFGNQTIPNFDVFASTSRKYRIGYMILLQSLQQLTTRYGANKAATIMDSLAGELYFPGQDIDVASKLARRIGREHKLSTLFGKKQSSSEEIMTEDRIVKMRKDRALLFHGSREPCKLWMTPYFKQWRLKQRTDRPPLELARRTLPDIDYISLEDAGLYQNSLFNPDHVEG